MNEMKPKVKLTPSTVAIIVLSAVLTLYTATRSLDVIGLSLPAGKQLAAWPALGAFDVGLWLWTIHVVTGARGWQKVISWVMIAVDVLAIGLLMYVDAAWVLAVFGNLAMPVGLKSAIAAGTSLVVVLTVVAGVLDLALAPLVRQRNQVDDLQATRTQAEFDLQMARLRADLQSQVKVNELTLAEYERNMGIVATEMAIAKAEQLMHTAMAAEGFTPEQARRYAERVRREIRHDQNEAAAADDQPVVKVQPALALPVAELETLGWPVKKNGNGNGNGSKNL